MVSIVRRFISAVVLFSLIAFAASAQVSEVIEVRVIEIEVVVVDSHGDPVRGLTKGDFELREGGQPREITNFYAVDRGQLLREPLPDAARDAPPPEPPPNVLWKASGAVGKLVELVLPVTYALPRVSTAMPMPCSSPLPPR